jgi:hypothetical protein
MKHIILIILVLISSLFIVKAQPTIPDATCLDVYYYDSYFKQQEDSEFIELIKNTKGKLFCSNSDYIETTVYGDVKMLIHLDSMTYKMQTETISVFSYAAHTNDCKFAVTFSFSNKAPTQSRHMVRVENLTVPMLYIFHLNPDSL